MIQCDEKDFKPITTYYCTSCEALKKELKKVKQEKKKLSIKNGSYKRKIEKLLQTWLDSLCENKSFISEEKLKQELQKYDKDKLIELYLQMRFERDVWKDLEEKIK